MRQPFLDRLEHRVLVGDGAMGTELYARGIPFSHSFEGLNLTSPQTVKDVHLSYVRSGAEVIQTNTFGANRLRLEKFGLADKVREINLAGARLAREVAGDDLYVAGSVGPLGVRIEPLGPTSRAEAREIFREQIAGLVEGGVDLIVIETMVDPEEAHQALEAAREAASGLAGAGARAGSDVSADLLKRLPVVVEMTVQEDGNTPIGARPEDFSRNLELWGADLIGLNCSVGPAPMLEVLERMAAVTSRKLSAQPNAGLPSTVQGRNMYLCSPEYMAGYARRFIEAGARLVGGCCGTTPAHIQAIKAAIRSMSPPPTRVSVHTGAEKRPSMLEPVPVGKRSRLAERLERGEFPVLVEIVPPKGADATKEIDGASYLAAEKVDAVVVPDGSGTTARMSAQTLAVLLGQKAGVEPVLFYSCRDRNLLRIQSDLLGAHALGLRNILAITGDPPPFSIYPGANAIFDVDSIGLVNVLNNLNRGLDVGGNPLGTRTSFLIGVGANPFAPDFEEQMRRFEYKMEAGANFALTQPVFDVDRLAAFLKRVGPGRIPVLAAITTLTSFRNAEFLNNEVPGIVIPQPILDRMRRADTGERARVEGVRIAQETLLAIRELVQGVVIAAPFGRYAMAIEVASVLAPAAGAVSVG